MEQAGKDPPDAIRQPESPAANIEQPPPPVPAPAPHNDLQPAAAASHGLQQEAAPTPASQERSLIADFSEPFSHQTRPLARLMLTQRRLLMNPAMMSRLITTACPHDPESGPHCDVARLRPLAAQQLADHLIRDDTLQKSPRVQLRGRAGHLQSDIRSLAGAEFTRSLLNDNGSRRYGSASVPQFVDRNTRSGDVEQAAINDHHVTDAAVDGLLFLAAVTSSLGCLRLNGPQIAAERIPTLTATAISIGLQPLLQTEAALLNLDVVMLPICEDDHWTIAFVWIQKNKDGTVRLIFVYHDPVVYDSYAPGLTEEMVRKLNAIKKATAAALSEADRQRVADYAFMALSHTHGHHQTRGGPCGLMILAAARCFLEGRPLHMTMEEVMARGPVFAYELLHGCQLPLVGFSDRKTGVPAMCAEQLNKPHVDSIRAERISPESGLYQGPQEPMPPHAPASLLPAAFFVQRAAAARDQPYQLDEPIPLLLNERTPDPDIPKKRSGRMKTKKPQPPKEAAVPEMPGAAEFAELERTAADRKEAARLKMNKDRKAAATSEQAARTASDTAASGWKPPDRRMPGDQSDVLDLLTEVDQQEASVIMTFKRTYQRRAPHMDRIVFDADLISLLGMSTIQGAAVVAKTSGHLLTAYKRLEDLNQQRLLDLIDLRETANKPHDDPHHEICDRRLNDLQEKFERYKADMTKTLIEQTERKREQHFLEMRNRQLQASLEECHRHRLAGIIGLNPDSPGFQEAVRMMPESDVRRLMEGSALLQKWINLSRLTRHEQKTTIEVIPASEQEPPQHKKPQSEPAASIVLCEDCANAEKPSPILNASPAPSAASSLAGNDGWSPDQLAAAKKPHENKKTACSNGEMDDDMFGDLTLNMDDESEDQEKLMQMLGMADPPAQKPAVDEPRVDPRIVQREKKEAAAAAERERAAADQEAADEEAAATERAAADKEAAAKQQAADAAAEQQQRDAAAKAAVDRNAAAKQQERDAAAQAAEEEARRKAAAVINKEAEVSKAAAATAEKERMEREAAAIDEAAAAAKRQADIPPEQESRRPPTAGRGRGKPTRSPSPSGRAPPAVVQKKKRPPPTDAPDRPKRHKTPVVLPVPERPGSKGSRSPSPVRTEPPAEDAPIDCPGGTTRFSDRFLRKVDARGLLQALYGDRSLYSMRLAGKKPPLRTTTGWNGLTGGNENGTTTLDTLYQQPRRLTFPAWYRELGHDFLVAPPERKDDERWPNRTYGTALTLRT